MNIENQKNSLCLVASIGLGVGGLFGMAGSFAPTEELRGLAWGIIVASSLRDWQRPTDPVF